MRLNDVIKIFNVAIYTSQIKHAGYGTLARRCLLQRGEVETMQMFPMLALLQCRPGVMLTYRPCVGSWDENLYSRFCYHQILDNNIACYRGILLYCCTNGT